MYALATKLYQQQQTNPEQGQEEKKDDVKEAEYEEK